MISTHTDTKDIRRSVLVAPIDKGFKTNNTVSEGTPVYLYRSLFAEMSQLGSDLMVEPYDEVDY